MVNKTLKKYLSQIGRKGGQKSRRKLDAGTAKKMGMLRTARKAYREHHTQCFWSYDPRLTITLADIRWVGLQLLKHGGMQLMPLGKKLCQ